MNKEWKREQKTNIQTDTLIPRNENVRALTFENQIEIKNERTKDYQIVRTCRKENEKIEDEQIRKGCAFKVSHYDFISR